MSEFVLVKRELLDHWAERFSKAQIFKESSEARAVLAQEAGPVVEQQEPVAYLVTDVYGQKKALRSGAEGIERHRNAGSSLVPLFASPPAPVAVVLTTRDVMMAMESANATDFIRGTFNWCAHMAKELNACLDKVKELNQ